MGVVGRLDQYASMLAGEFDDYSMSENIIINSTSTSAWNNGTFTTETQFPIKQLHTVRITNLSTDGDSPFLSASLITTPGFYTVSHFIDTVNSTCSSVTIHIFGTTANGNSYATANFNLSTKAFGAVSYSGTSWSNGSTNAIDYGNGIYKISITAEVLLATTATRAYVIPSPADTSYIILAGPQYESGTVATDYTPTFGTATTRSVASTTNINISSTSVFYASGFEENTGFTNTLVANVFPPYDPVYDEFGGTLFGAGQGRYMRQNTNKSVIVYNEIDEITDFRDIVRTGLVLDLDAGMNASFNNTGTTWTDLSGRGNNGTLINSPSYNSNNGGYLSFNGSSNYGVITNFIPTISDITVDMWLYVPSISSDMSFISSTDPTTSAPEFFQFGVDSSKYLTAKYAFNQSSSNGVGVDLIGKENSWVNVVVTIQNGNSNPGTIIYYVNNISSISITYGGIFFSGASPTMATRWTIAGFSNPFNTPVFQNGYNGRISTIKIYNRALTATEILQNYNALKHRFGL